MVWSLTAADRMVAAEPECGIYKLIGADAGTELNSARPMGCF
jgi:hypothetical protein